MLASSNDIDSEAILGAYESALKELESVVGSEPSNSAGISEKLLNVLLTRDKVQKDVVPNISGGSAGVGLKLHELDEELKVNFRVINRSLKPKTKIEILASLEEVRNMVEVTLIRWWWYLKIEIYSDLRWRIVNPVMRFLSLMLLGISIFYFSGTVYAWANGSFVLNTLQSVFTVVGSIGSVLGITSFFNDYIKNLFSDLIKNKKGLSLKGLFDAKGIQMYKLHQFPCYRERWIIVIILTFLWSLGSYVIYENLKKEAININNKTLTKYWSSETSLDESKNQIKRSISLDPTNKDLHRNLAFVYENSYELDNAIKEYKALLPDLDATIELIRLHILKLNENKKKDQDYDKNLALLVYILQNSYINYCINNYEQLQKSNEIVTCSYLENQSKVHDQEFLRMTFRFFNILGWARMIQGQYTQAKLDLQQSINLANIGLGSFKENSLDWERRKAQASCLMVQVLDKQKRDPSIFWKQCHDYKPRSTDDYTLWTPEYYIFSDPDLQKRTIISK